jgi:hypothetical protein
MSDLHCHVRLERTGEFLKTLNKPENTACNFYRQEEFHRGFANKKRR